MRRKLIKLKLFDIIKPRTEKKLFGHCNRTLSKSAYLLSARVFHLEKQKKILQFSSPVSIFRKTKLKFKLILKGLTLLTVNLSQFINQLMKQKVIIYSKIINSLPWMEAMSSVDNGFVST